MPHLMRIAGLVNGGITPFDGQYLSAYDPSRPGVSPDGRHMRAHIACTPDQDQAIHFEDMAALHATWTAATGQLRPDGQPDRPLTAFNIEIITPTRVRVEDDRNGA